MGRYSKMVGAFATGAIGTGIGANFIPSLTEVTMFAIFSAEPLVPTTVYEATAVIVTTGYGLLIGGLSAAVGAYGAPANTGGA